MPSGSGLNLTHFLLFRNSLTHAVKFLLSADEEAAVGSGDTAAATGGIAIRFAAVAHGVHAQEFEAVTACFDHIDIAPEVGDVELAIGHGGAAFKFGFAARLTCPDDFARLWLHTADGAAATVHHVKAAVVIGGGGDVRRYDLRIAGP